MYSFLFKKYYNHSILNSYIYKYNIIYYIMYNLCYFFLQYSYFFLKDIFIVSLDIGNVIDVVSNVPKKLNSKYKSKLFILDNFTFTYSNIDNTIVIGSLLMNYYSFKDYIISNDEVDNYNKQIDSTFISYIIDPKFIIHNYWNFRVLDDLKMFYLKSTIEKPNVLQFLSSRYGIGMNLSKKIITFLGIHINFKYEFVPVYFFFTKLKNLLSKHVKLLDSNLSEFVLSMHKSLIRLNSYKGLRLLNGYPIHGQRTRSNHKTALKFPYTLKFKHLYLK